MGAMHQISEMRREELKHPVNEDIFVSIYANIDAAFASQSDAVGLLEALSMVARNVEFLHQRTHIEPQHLDRGARVLDRILAEQKKREKIGWQISKEADF
jgi:hypothetical protein